MNQKMFRFSRLIGLSAAVAAVLAAAWLGNASAAAKPQPGPVVRANYPTAAEDTPHAWTVKPENGGWMILVKGYVGADARPLAEQLCRDIRENHSRVGWSSATLGTSCRRSASPPHLVSSPSSHRLRSAGVGAHG